MRHNVLPTLQCNTWSSEPTLDLQHEEVMKSDSKNAISGRWIETLREIFPASEGYTLNATIHEYRGSKHHESDDNDADNVIAYDRLAVYYSEYQGEIFSMVLECRDESSAGAPEPGSGVADAVISARSKFLLKGWPATLLPIPTYGGVIALNDVFVYGFRSYCVEPWCDLDLVCDDPQHFKKEEYGQLFRLFLDPQREAQGLRVDDAQLFTEWLAEWKASLASKGPAESLSFEPLMQGSGQAPKVGEFNCPALEDMNLAETRTGPHWLHTPGGALQEADEFRLPEGMKRRIEFSLPSHALETLEGVPVCAEDDISLGSLSPILEDTREDFLLECLGDAPEPALDSPPDCMELEQVIEEATRNFLLQLLGEEDPDEFD
ncbi:hypothetical protein BO82DRAFT_368537 [Aspergillus uvarum CBS 121591]|uniref:Uncharacterized protein n=1 Tax=Aspergillus uvarum CBS 121591 TaxID=1448315 RepID=A0A319BZB5_9EURO|nr:hypothetical protein BO82DRAFT_368537 [Aspergillus uvarum CBS 121591]PYH77467.1 hypothetical protein BO82DRAFT_368537 [Aspergillus uvarum CBS 121591]